mmetsp:Transcript_27116/g.45208  ORF Transcript_27116/g.45208 Transcript_27116/m.45208 type:complete len:193 (-) Transcript_27116:401-979(-)|eukprot:CAMPEP_0119011968 /NCGR_PEP_ID=MMETSP1176-20130426/5996_1 /TAXON_ID=265551 /ORGANISM="Synedropsis recta cf, Strain CCMP1620" /LENGTH=192 /DNA_ID=CAMNT_0006964855 /DNA_START=126 /DNA_END=701 /DNA_ORIENTATION=-
MDHSPSTITRHVRFQLLDKENQGEDEAPRTPSAATVSNNYQPQRTPQSGSKVLRQHFSQTTPRRRLLESGAVRVVVVPKQESQQRRRIGYDGTTLTPSKQLLQSTAASRNQQVRGHHPIVRLLHDDDETAAQQENHCLEQQHRLHRGDFDPVASTLLRRQDTIEQEPPKNVFTGDLQDLSGVHRPVATKLTW